MKKNSSRIIFGAGLILLGILFFLQSLLHIDIGGLVIAGFFVLGVAVFFYVFGNNTENWWALIPGFTLAAIGGLIAMSSLNERIASLFGGAFFLAMIGLSFLVIYIIHRDFWWAIIPAGVLFTLALVTIVGQYNGLFSGAVFFLGLAATFGVLGLMPVGKKDKWPWIPAGICALIGVIIAVGSGIFVNSVFAYLTPAILLVAGVYLIVRSMRQQG
jgi:hypothetical protein